MNILFIEPFYSGSHKTWLDQLVKHSSHTIDLLTMDGRFWKWRMYGASVTMSQKLEDYTKAVDLIIVSDMIDLSTFIAISRNRLRQLGNPKIGVYFHENQLAYPWQEASDDRSNNRDVHYGMMNYTTALSSDFLMFNSAYNMNSFFHELTLILKKMPDYSHISDTINTIEHIKAKARILPIGINSPCQVKEKDALGQSNPSQGLSKIPNDLNITRPLILWNHRLEHDKNPKLFFETLIKLKDEKYDFSLALLGESNKSNLKLYKPYLDQLSDKIITQGFLSKEDYIFFLQESDITPVTSNHDFFGISVMEAISYGSYPLLPKRLTYPELYDSLSNPEYFYESDNELLERLIHLIKESTLYKKTHKSNIEKLTKAYEWENLISHYDSLFESFLV